MSGEGDGVLTVPILIFTSVIVSFTYFIVKFLNTKSTPQNVKKDKPKMKEPKQQHKAEKQPRTKEPANKNMPKTSHPHLITTLKGHKNNLTGGDFSPSGKYFLTASKGEGDPEDPNKEWFIAAPLTPSDTEESVTSTSSSNQSTESKLSRRQKKNQNKRTAKKPKQIKRKKMYSQIPTHCHSQELYMAHPLTWAESPAYFPSQNYSPVPSPPIGMYPKSSASSSHRSSSEEFPPLQKPAHKIVLKNIPLELCLNVDERIMYGFPYETDMGVFVHKVQGYSKVEQILKDQRLVGAELEDSKDSPTKAVAQNPMYAVGHFNAIRAPHYGMPQLNIRICTRCKNQFALEYNGYTEPCLYHPQKAVLNTEKGFYKYPCCNQPAYDSGDQGCTPSPFHVFHQLGPGTNGPLLGYKSTALLHKRVQVQSQSSKVLGLDCEMVFTSEGFEVARATLVSGNGETLFDEYIMPLGQIFDLNTAYSGIDAKHVAHGIPFLAAQDRLLKLISSSDKLVGHSLEGDLIALKIVHRRIVDTSLLFMSPCDRSLDRRTSPLPRRQRLKTLVKTYLDQDIQKDDVIGHSSFEDALSTLKLVNHYVKHKPV